MPERISYAQQETQPEGASNEELSFGDVYEEIREYDQGCNLPDDIVAKLLKSNCGKRRPKHMDNKVISVSTANELMVEFNMTQGFFANLVVEVEGSDKDDVLDFLNGNLEEEDGDDVWR